MADPSLQDELNQRLTLRSSSSFSTKYAEVRTSEAIGRGVIQIATGAWLDPHGDLCRRGNPNVQTLYKGTSKLAQGPIAHSCLVKIEPWIPPAIIG